MKKILSTNKLAPLSLMCLLLVPVVQAEDLFAVYQHAKESDPLIRASEANYFATLEKKPQALASLGSNVTLSGSASLKDTQSWSAATSDNKLQASAGYQLNFNKPLYREQLNEQVAQTNFIIAQAEQSFIAEQQNLILRVSEAYFDYLNARDAAELTRAEATAIERQNRQVDAYVYAGKSAITDLKESQARYDQSLSSVVVADKNVEVALETLRSLTGRDYNILRGATNSTPMTPPVPNKIENWSEAAVKNNKDVVVAQLAVQVAQKNVDIARAGKKPTVDFFARHTGNIIEGESTSDSQSLDASIGIQFNMTLYDAGKADSQVREARFSLRQAIHQLESRKRTVSQQTRSHYLNVVTGLTQIAALKTSLQSTEVSRKATEEGFRAGTRTAVDVILAYRDTYQAQSNYSSARNAFLLNKIRLKHAAGMLNEKDLQDLSRILNRSRSSRAKPYQRPSK